MSAVVFLEGGGDTESLRRKCREAFRKLLINCGFSGRLPQLRACGSRENAFKEFAVADAHSGRVDYVAMLIDSEAPVADVERTWDHLRRRDRWRKPSDATDDQVLFMVTSMETWIATDHEALRKRFPRDFNGKRLPEPNRIEVRHRNDVLTALKRATNNRYSKGATSFELLGSLYPGTLQQLPSFRRARRILNEKLGS